MGQEQSEAQVRESIVDMVAEIAERDPAQVRTDEALRAELEVDSLALVELVIAIEQEFGVRIPDEDAKTLRTIDDHVSYVRSARADQSA